MNDHITVKARDGTFTAYIARPEELPAPAVVVLQELFGVNADIREKCDGLRLYQARYRLHQKESGSRYRRRDGCTAG
jgi:hypothetical protein